MDAKREMLRHELAAIAYRTRKALRDAPAEFGDLRVAAGVRTPRELLRHMSGVLGYARTFFTGGTYRPAPLATLEEELERLHELLASLSEHFAADSFERMSPEAFLQGPLSDAMTHAGQLAMLRRLAGSPVPPENFLFADIDADNVGPNQPDPVAPDDEWHTPDGR